MDAYVSLDETPGVKVLRKFPQLNDCDVGSGNDIYICGDNCRNRAVSGDIVAISILSEKAAAYVYKCNRLREDKRKDRVTKQRKDRLARMSSEVRAATSSGVDSVSESSGADASEQSNVTTRSIPKVFGVVVAVISHNTDRVFAGVLSSSPPPSISKHRLFLESLKKPVLWFKPLDASIPFMYVLADDVPASLRDGPRHHYCTMRMGAWLTTEPIPKASFVKDLGMRGSIEVETQLILEENGVCVVPFTPDVLRCLPKSPWHIPPIDIRSRTDLRSECIFTVDPSTARDLDDAVSCRALPNGNFLVGVHIADVSYFVRPKTSLDREARKRATTTYMVQRAYPMLPSMLCEDLCSLNPGVDRLAFSVMWEIEPQSATVLSTWFGRTVINSACKLSYDDAQAVIDGERLSRAAACFEYLHGQLVSASSGRRHEIESSIRTFYGLSKAMRKRRFDEGALSLSSVKLSFELDDSGAPVDCWPYAIKDSNRLIEEFMLLANMSVAARIEASFPDASLLRRHSPPLQRRLDELCQQLAQTGIKINPGSAGDISKSLEEITDPDLRFTVEEMLTSPMQRAAYFSTHAIKDKSGYSHYALNVPLYTHFTSPIRRYADVIVHRTLEASLAVHGNHVISDHPLLPRYYSSYFPKTSAKGSLTTSLSKARALLIPNSKAISAIAHHCNLRKDAAKKAQEACAKLFLVNYLASMEPRVDIPGVITSAVVIKIGQNGLSFTAPSFGVDGTIYMDRMADNENCVVSTNSCKWKLHLWSVESAILTLVWKTTLPNSVDDLAESLSALVIDNTGHSIKRLDCHGTAETTVESLHIFDKITVCLLPETNPPGLNIKLVMPSLAR
ncbi:RNB-domain-containing protein [Coemansia reversa NRRL 1564]|uniref:RNB-domain-containing protein n=1 Tax=Coemansia reversa (strain ATCC 12441 / NRRL 1564) TaxID=763665 RepID=A0A2G5BEW3_COERN|nr:RNB-domain-containing protein [Coemansia reversa NRRL 1564]|eukprot:PIA17543.1 RNB-domain-containing protein [Coemansia reversa NRRL 1564]